MATEDEDAAYFLEAVTLEEDEDDEYDYKEVDVEEDLEEDIDGEAADEDLEQALKTLKTKDLGAATLKEDVQRPAITKRPEVLDDFIRNVLLKLGMVRRAATPPQHDTTRAEPRLVLGGAPSALALRRCCCCDLAPLAGSPARRQTGVPTSHPLLRAGAPRPLTARHDPPARPADGDAGPVPARVVPAERGGEAVGA